MIPSSYMGRTNLVWNSFEEAVTNKGKQKRGSNVGELSKSKPDQDDVLVSVPLLFPQAKERKQNK